MYLTPKLLIEYAQKCREDGQSEETIKVKLRNLRTFFNFCGGRKITSKLLSLWREYIAEKYVKPHTRNNMVSKTNVFLDFFGLPDMKMKYFEIDRHILHTKLDKNVTLDELKAMLEYTEKKGKVKMNLLLRVLAITGIRSGEIQHITVEAVDAGYAEFIHHKKNRKVLLPENLRKRLKDYADAQDITFGPIFISRNGNPIHQRGIGTELKTIAEKVGIPKNKINPTAFRILFANTYYEKYGDLSGLTDLLGVKDMNMSVLYIKETEYTNNDDA